MLFFFIIRYHIFKKPDQLYALRLVHKCSYVKVFLRSVWLLGNMSRLMTKKSSEVLVLSSAHSRESENFSNMRAKEIPAWKAWSKVLGKYFKCELEKFEGFV